MATFVRLVLLLVLLLVVGAGLIAFALRPPAPLRPAAPGAVLAGVTVIEPGVSRLPGRTITVEGDTIRSVESEADGAGPYAGMFVLPGLTDMHVHFPPAAVPGQSSLWSLLHVSHGVLAVRDAADVDGTASAPAREGVRGGAFLGPRMFSCGPLVDGDPPRWGNSLVSTTPEAGRAAVTRVAEEGFECVKVYDELDAATLAAIREEARRRKLPVIGHVPKRVRILEAALDDAQHLIGVAPPYPDPTTQPAFPHVLEAWLRLDEARLAHVIEGSLAQGIAHTPTLVTIERLLATQDYDRIRQEPDAQLLARFYRDVIWSPHGGISAAAGLGPEDFAMVRRAYEIQKRTLRRMHEAGVALHTGTDALIAFIVPGAALHRELRLWVEAGIPAEAVLHASMVSSAKFLDPALGEIRAGAPAELLVFREDPTHDLAALDSLVAVVREGRLHSRAMLDEQLARERAHFEGALYDTILTPVVRRVLARTAPEAD